MVLLNGFVFPFNKRKFWNSVLRLLSIKNAIDESERNKKKNEFEIVIELARKWNKTMREHK